MSDPAPVVPPNSFTSISLTAPPSEDKRLRAPVAQILEAVRNRRHGSSQIPPWHQFKLQPEQYADLLEEVTKESDSFQGDWEHKIRHDFFPSISKLVLRMPSTVHGYFISSVVEEITRQINSLSSGNSPTADFAKHIKHRGSTTIRLPDEYGRHDPDSSFGHKNAQYPGVVLEVSYSQKRQDLGRLVDDYILGSDGNIRVVVELDIQYKRRLKEFSDKAATLSIWRPKITSDGDTKVLTTFQDVVDLEFRGKDGIASPEAGLILRLDDFAISCLHPNPMPEEIFISAATLTEYLVEAERQELMIQENTGAREMLGPLVRKRKRMSTRVEELDEVQDIPRA